MHMVLWISLDHSYRNFDDFVDFSRARIHKHVRWVLMGRAGCPGLSFLSQPEVSLMSCGLAMSYFLESVVKAVKAGRLNSAER